MAYSQWVNFNVNDIGTIPIKVANLVILYGKLYSGSMDNEVSTSSVNGHVIDPEAAYLIQACGRSDEPAGTQGSFDLVSAVDNTAIASISWSCPWGNKANSFNISATNGQWLVDGTGANLYAGAIGTVIITCVNRP